MKKVYLICPVRKATVEETSRMGMYVTALERSGFEVHYPPRDVDQSNLDGGVNICYSHREAMLDCDEVHIWWNGSTGSHFDLGMAYMLAMFKEVKFVNANNFEAVEPKDFQNVAYDLCATSAIAEEHVASNLPAKPDEDSGNRFLGELSKICGDDAKGLKKAAESYGPSWKQRGGIGAYMMLARKWDRMENRVKKMGWDIFRAIFEDKRGEGVIDDVRDLRRYLALVEAEVTARGFKALHRDNGGKVA